MDKRFVEGAVSIFSVVFAALLLTVLTVGFIGLMISEQQRSSNNDLSQSAYDSALAGVEDAKRAIRACSAGNNSACVAIYAIDDCKVVARSGVAGDLTADETIVRSNISSGEQFNQAYTCVNIAMDTEDYLYSAKEGLAEIIPLRSKGDFDQIIIEWYTSTDAGSGAQAMAHSGNLLPKKEDWPATAPPVIRAQLITPGASFSVASLDGRDASQTVFVKPSAAVGGETSNTVTISPGIHPRPVDSEEFNNNPQPISCSREYSNSGYSCKVVLDLGRSVSSADSKNAFLRLNTIYRGASVRVQLASSGGGIAKFDGVQPMVDSTGRASDLFRRVEARLKVGDDFPYPNYSADVANSLCKDFSVYATGSVAGACVP